MAGDMSFRIDVQGAEELMAKIVATQAQLIADAKRETLAAGRAIRQTARSLSKSQSMPDLSRSIDTRTTQYATGIEVTIEAKSPFGYGREYGFGRNVPRPFMGPAGQLHIPKWEQRIADCLDRQPL